MNSELESRWQDYLFLTTEMKKFLTKRDLDMFFSLLEQRTTLQTELKKIPDKDYYASAQGKNLLLTIQREDKAMQQQFYLLYNRLKNRDNISQAYDGMTNFAGGFINQKT